MIDNQDYQAVVELEESVAGTLGLEPHSRAELIARAKKIISSYGAFLRRANKAVRAAEEESNGR